MPSTAYTVEHCSLAERLKEPQAALPFITAAIEGVGGVIKAQPEHFAVEEILPYAPCGEGEHLFVKLRRSGWNTADVARVLAQTLGIDIGAVGWGGRKDKQAVTTQTFSLPLPLHRPKAEIQKVLAGLPFELLELERHRHKLKTGHVAANRFRIVLTQVDRQSLSRAQTIATLLTERGLPNFFGEQRFGVALRNLDKAAVMVQRQRPVRGGPGAFLVSALQGALFNIWLKERIGRGDFERLLAGDIARKTDTGGIFRVDRPAVEQTRLDSGAIVVTGPLYGHKMMAAEGEAGCFETAVLEDLALTPQVFKTLRAAGSRRPALVRPRGLSICSVTDGLEFSFTLPSGTYATTLMREFTRMPGMSAATLGP